MVELRVVALDPDVPTPSYAHATDAGADLYAREDAHLAPGGGRALVPTGIAIELPVGLLGLVLPRSGLAVRHGVTLVNTPGLIDPGYRGEIKVVMVNTDPVAAYTVRRGDRVAQLLVLPFDRLRLVVVDELEPSERGGGGFGHSGR